MAHELRALVPRSYGAFLGRFERPSAVQCAAIPAILSGRDVLICAPTASGKTEAFAAPLAEAVWAVGPAPGRALLISPTRALANDLHRRMVAPFAAVGLGLGRYTGEHKERSASGLADVVIATPEALDSLLARRVALLANVRCVVLDEIHVLDGGARGDQLRLLLHRLERAVAVRPQRVAVSATVAELERTRDRYLAADAAIVAVGGRRPIRARRFAGTDADALAGHLPALAASGARKVLVFCNSRAAVEQLCAATRGATPFGDRVFAHHGSMARASRERTEALLQSLPAAVVFTTSTLEMGIDVGSVDAVLLRDPPPSVASAVQRVGRGNRRAGVIRSAYCAADVGQAHLVRAMLAAGAAGELLGAPVTLRPSVVVQQALVLCGSRSYLDAGALHAAVPAWFWDEVAPTNAAEILATMADRGLLERAGVGRYVHSAASDRRYLRGGLHSNLDDELLLDVVDRLTGEVLGHVAEAPRQHSIAGRNVEVVAERAGALLVDVRAGAAAAPTFRSRGVPLVSFALGRHVVERLGVGADELWWVDGRGGHWLVHGLGTVGALWLSDALRRAHGKRAVVAVSPFVLQLARRLDVAVPAAELGDGPPATAAARAFVVRNAAKLAKLCQMGPHHSTLPVELAQRSLLAASGIAELAAFVGSAMWCRRVDLDDDTLDVVATL